MKNHIKYCKFLNKNRNLNRSIANKEILIVIEKLPTEKSQGPDGFTGKFHLRFKEEILSIP